MRVLVTGADGYVGSILVPMLEARGHDVTGVDAGLFQACGFGKSGYRAKSVRKDFRDLETSELAGHDALIHLAALSNDPLSDLDPALTREINHQSAVDLAVKARQGGVCRFVQSSTCSVYGRNDQSLIDEHSALNPLTPYAESKLLAEFDIARLGVSGFEPVFLRHGTAYGVSPMLRFDLVANNLVAWGYTTGNILLKSDGSAWRPLVHVEDICQSFVAALEAPGHAVAGEIFNICRTEDNVKIRDLADQIATAMPDCRVTFADGASADSRSYRVDGRKAEAKLPGFAPRWSVAQGIQQLVAAVQCSDISRGEIEGRRYDRVAQLKQLISVGAVDETLRYKQVEKSFDEFGVDQRGAMPGLHE